ncbi:lipase family protein [Nitrosomonas sp. Nm132]|jgi:triacylglycerol lipase|uniref:lipase family protein n=1 Tax=Nitrosomonas sp. Nm132 TaxID=1881053 RepID=UPI00089135C1|nr:lipase family protein [Nitrosomonas sp. Nm132]SDG84467.1 triacylglycerol lipase [Nitrosomonas sp. Nm132]
MGTRRPTDFHRFLLITGEQPVNQRDYRYDREKNPFNPAATGFAPNNALCLAAASNLVYEESDSLRAEEVHKWGFNQFKLISIPKKPFIDTQAFVCADPDVLLVAFRGTEPDDLKDWLTDAQFDLTDGPIKNIKNKVHRGFHEALNAAWPQLEAAIADLRTHNQAIWVTGHSLGAALATLAVARLSLGDGVRSQQLDVQGLYTFGQPRTGNRSFATAFDQRFKGRSFRFVNNNDLIAEVPQMDLLLRYWHIDQLIYIDESGKLHPGVSMFRRVLDGLKGLRRDFGRLGFDTLKDHSMNNYVQAVRKYVEDLKTGQQTPIS